MRRLLIAVAGLLFATAAQAGDGYGPAKSFSWTGLYVGGNVNYSWADVAVTDTNGGVSSQGIPFPFDAKGFGGGLQAGYNLQLGGPLLAGIEVEGGYLGVSGSKKIKSDATDPTRYQVIDLDGGLYGLISGRLGFILAERTLIYGKAGYAWTDLDGGQTTTNPGYVTHRTSGLQGAVFGGGVEHAISNGWTIKVEYLRFDLGTGHGDQTSVSDPPVGFVYENKHDVTVDTLKFGANFRF